MAVLVDSNLILDVATNDPAWGDWSSRALARAADESVLVITLTGPSALRDEPLA